MTEIVKGCDIDPTSREWDGPAQYREDGGEWIDTTIRGEHFFCERGRTRVLDLSGSVVEFRRPPSPAETSQEVVKGPNVDFTGFTEFRYAQRESGWYSTVISENGMFLDEDGDAAYVHTACYEFRRPAPDPDGERWRKLLQVLSAKDDAGDTENLPYSFEIFGDGCTRMRNGRDTQCGQWDTVEDLDAYLSEPQPGPWVPREKVDWVGPAEAAMSADGGQSMPVSLMWIVGDQEYLTWPGEVWPMTNWRYYRKPATASDGVWTDMQRHAEARERLKQPLVVPGIPPTLVIPEGQESLRHTLKSGEQITVTRPQPEGAQ